MIVSFHERRAQAAGCVGQDFASRLLLVAASCLRQVGVADLVRGESLGITAGLRTSEAKSSSEQGFARTAATSWSPTLWLLGDAQEVISIRAGWLVG